MSKSQTIQALRSIPLLSALSQRELRLVADLTGTRSYRKGQTVVAEGEMAQEMFIIESGSAKVTRRRRRVAELGPGDYFGEMSLINKAPRSATVVAQNDLVVRVLGRWSFAALVEQVPSINRRLLDTMAKRIRDLGGSTLE